MKPASDTPRKRRSKGKHFESLEEAQAYLDRWEARCADTRIHGTTKRQVAAMFAEEKPALLPLPLEPFRYYQGVVHLDSCVEVEAAYYGLPPGWIGRQVNVQGMGCSFASLIQRPVSCCANMYARNVAGIASKQRTTRSRDRCASLSYCGEPAERALRSARSATLIYSQQGEPGVCRVLGVLSLAKKFGTAAVEDACAAALEMGVHEYRFVRRYLERKPPIPLSLRQVHPLIRQLTLYRDIIQNRTQERQE